MGKPPAIGAARRERRGAMKQHGGETASPKGSQVAGGEGASGVGDSASGFEPRPLRAALREWQLRLGEAGSDEPEVEARLIATHLLGLSPGELALHLSEPVPQELAGEADRIIAARARHVPLPYLFGGIYFFGLRLRCDARALVPRPETELLAQAAIDWAHEAGEAGLLVDVGTGSGCVACAFADHHRDWRVVATDISAEALALAAENARALGLADHITFLQGDLLEPVHEAGLASEVTLLVANLPYVSEEEYAGAQPELHHEPREALVAGPTGLEVIARLLRQLASLPALQFAALEIGAPQGMAAKALAREALPGWSVEVWPDLAGLDRLLVVRRRAAGQEGRA